MRYRFDGRVALITGAGKGLGRAYAEELARRGARVLVNNRSHGGEGVRSADQTVAAICASGGEAIANYASVEQSRSAPQMVEQAMDAWGRIDIVVHNAAIARSEYFTRMSEADFAEIMRINFAAPVALTRAALPCMRNASYGRMLFCTSAAGLYGNRGQSAYAASKAAMIAFMQSIRLEESSYDFRANAIAPFAVTQMTAAHLPEHVAGAFEARFPAALAAYLVHQDCCCNGDVILAGASTFRNARSAEGDGVRFRHPQEITTENIAARIDALCALDSATVQNSADACFQRFCTDISID